MIDGEGHHSKHEVGHHLARAPRGMAACESCSEAAVRSQLIGICPSATSRWSLYPRRQRWLPSLARQAAARQGSAALLRPPPHARRQRFVRGQCVVAFPDLNGGRVARNVSDQTVVLGSGDHSLMQTLRQLGPSKLRKSTRKSRLVREITGLFPAAEAPQTFIGAQPVDAIASGGQVEHCLGEKGGGECWATVARMTDEAATGEHILG